MSSRTNSSNKNSKGACVAGPDAVRGHRARFSSKVSLTGLAFLFPLLALAQPTLPEPQASAPEAAASVAAPPPAPMPVAPAPKPKAAPVTAPTTLLPPPLWQDLSRGQKAALAPLERDWNGMDEMQRSKWLEMAPRFAALPESEQARLHERMRDWSRMSPAERQQARVSWQAAKQLKTDERQAKWEAYQALPPEKRQQLQEKAAEKRAARAPATPPRAEIKSNIVPSPPKNPLLPPVAPSVLQAKPGATTVLINQGKMPPSHQRPGQTKVFADPEQVDSKTLLPKQKNNK